MRHTLSILLFSLSFLGCNDLPHDILSIEPSELLKHKVDENRFELGWFPGAAPKKPLFRDYRAIDTEITLGPDRDTTSVFHPSNQPKKLGLTLMADSISLDEGKKRFSISGKIMGGHKGTRPEDYKVYIGKRKDTMVNVTFMASPHIDNYYQGRKIDGDIDFKVPAFCLPEPREFSVEQGREAREHVLHITAPISEKSVLVIALDNRYVEIFEIGKLIPEPED